MSYAENTSVAVEKTRAEIYKARDKNKDGTL